MTSLPYAEVIGDPIAQSKSPLIHNFWLARTGLAGDYRRQHVPATALAAYFAERRADPAWRGCNVTVPHKAAVIAHLDRLTPAAQTIGAVNLVVRDGDTLVGDNSDAPGFVEPLKPWLAQRHLFRMARILGTGGAARAVAHALAGQGFTNLILGRDLDKARDLQRMSGGDEALVAELASFAARTDFAFDDRTGLLDLVVNTTTLGMIGQPPLPLDFSHVPPHAIVYDIVYAPLETPLLAEARARGHPTIDGLAMLIGQAAHAFAAFFGTPAPRDRDAELRARLIA